MPSANQNTNQEVNFAAKKPVEFTPIPVSYADCGSNVFQVYFDDAKDSSQESRVKSQAIFKNQRVVQSKQISRIKIKVKIQEKTQLR